MNQAMNLMMMMALATNLLINSAAHAAAAIQFQPPHLPPYWQLVARVKALEIKVSTLQQTVGSQGNQINLLETRLSALESLSTNTRLANLEQKTQPMTNVTIDGNPSVLFSNVNVHIQSGSGSTNDAPNGKGNLVIGYNEQRPSPDPNIRTGSHNLVIGMRHNYSSYSGIAAGFSNTISAEFASVTGGVANTASGTYATVSGGSWNTASAHSSVVSGGKANLASNETASVCGGYGNWADGYNSSVSGGWGNAARSEASSIQGGAQNLATGLRSSISGSHNVTADQPNQWSVGGYVVN